MSRVLHRVVAAVILFTGASVALDAQKRDDKKSQESSLSAAQRQELTPVVTVVDEVMKGASPAGTYVVASAPAKESAAPQVQAAPAAVPLSWKNDFLKAQNGLIYVPFTVAVEPGKLASNSVVGYLRVAARGTTAPPAAPPERADKDKKDKKDAKKDDALFPFEDVYFTDLRGGSGQALRLTRAFAVPPGAYDVYVGIRDRGAAAPSGGAAPAAGGAPASSAAPEGTTKVAVLKQELDVPNYHSDELQTSSVIVADKIEQLTTPLQGDQAKERPYVLGDAEIVPAQDLKFRKNEEINVVFQVYGVKYGDDKKPDLTIEYAFFQKDGTAEKAFNKTPPQAFNAQTLPPNFDPTQGHQIVGGQAVPLTSFPEGDFRLEVKITDNKAGKTITRDVTFSVVPAS
jgi:hypothetical protein